MPDVTSDEHRRNADSLKQLLAAYQETQDLISIGAYQAGSNPLVDAAIKLRDETLKFLRQGMTEQVTFPSAVTSLAKLVQMRNALPRQTGGRPQNDPVR
jgi:flagellar biosynthesis/type III secretory pathway ATPase